MNSLHDGYMVDPFSQDVHRWFPGSLLQVRQLGVYISGGRVGINQRETHLPFQGLYTRYHGVDCVYRVSRLSIFYGRPFGDVNGHSIDST